MAKETKKSKSESKKTSKSKSSGEKQKKEILEECPICGNPLEPDWTVCSGCGAKNLKKSKSNTSSSKKVISQDEKDMDTSMKMFEQVQAAKIKRMEKEYELKEKEASFLKQQAKSDLEEEIAVSERKWKEESPQGLTPEKKKEVQKFQKELKEKVELRKKTAEESLGLQEELSKKSLELQDARIESMKGKLEITRKMDSGKITQEEADAELQKVNEKVKRLRTEVEELEKKNKQKNEEVAKAIAVPLPSLPLSVMQTSKKGEVKERHCPGCGESVSTTARACHSCGRILGEEDGYDSKEKKDKKEEEQKVKKKDRKCPHCGEDMNPKWASCPGCGKFVDRDAGYDHKEEKKEAEEEKKFEDEKKEDAEKEAEKETKGLPPVLTEEQKKALEQKGISSAVVEAEIAKAKSSKEPTFESRVIETLFGVLDHRLKEYEKLNEDKRAKELIEKGDFHSVTEIISARNLALGTFEAIANIATIYKTMGREDLHNVIKKSLDHYPSLGVLKEDGDLIFKEYPTEKLIESSMKESSKEKKEEKKGGGKVSQERAKLYKELGAEKLPLFLKELKKGREKVNDAEKRKEFDLYIKEVSEIIVLLNE